MDVGVKLCIWSFMQAIVICGGKGERLGALTSNCPKGMIRINGKPLLEYHLDWLKKYGIKEVIFACGHLHDQIQEYFGDGNKFSVKVHYSIEDKPLGRGGAIKKAWQKLEKNNIVIVTNGDIYTEMDLKNAILVHSEKNKSIGIEGTICLFPYQSSYGIVMVDGEHRINSFEEKPVLPYWINGGIYIFNYRIKDFLPEVGDHETETFPVLTAKKLLYGYTSNSYWRSVDTVKDVNEFSKYVGSKLLPR